ncbi:MAG: sensor domain-containing diguanylate cyclase [Desulfobulbaceae bacterium]|nr:sensor domain-containing diguanylate cyclase [Desulfobulbaceae bacterium]
MEENSLKFLQLESELRESRNRYQRMIESVTSYIFSVKVENGHPIETIHMPPCEAVTGYTPADFSANPYLWIEMVPVEDHQIVNDQASCILSGGKPKGIEHRIRKKDGTIRWVSNTPVPHYDIHDNLISYDGLILDITERKQLEEKLLAASITDHLTGLYNRRGLFILGDNQLKIFKRQNKGLILLYVDLDGLKTINDQFGHQEGDKAIVDCANILRGNYRESDIIARIGGDEFVVFPVGTTGDSTEAIISRLQKAVESYTSKNIRNYKLSFSCGIAICSPESNCSIGELLDQGDKSMYEQKRQKRKV